MNIQQKKATIWTAFVIGAIMFAVALYVLIRDVHMFGFEHEVMPYFVGFMIVLSLFLMLPVQMLFVSKTLLELIGPYLPEVRFGGRRRTDPPADDVVIVKPKDEDAEV